MNRRFQFRLRTLFIVMTVVAVLISQWPLVEWMPPQYRDTFVPWGNPVRPKAMAADGYYFVPARVWQIAARELLAILVLICGLRLLRKLRSKPTAISNKSKKLRDSI